MLKGKVALVTGGSRGIGRAICLELAAKGCSVAVVYQGNRDAAEDTVRALADLGADAQSFCCKVESADSVKTLVGEVIAKFGTVDILVNSAGIVKDGLLLGMSEQDFDSVIAVNLKGAFNTIKQLYPVFMKKRSGRIINISSVSGMMGNPGQANYSASKAGLIGLSKTVAKELAGRGVTCNVISPGFIETDMTDALSDVVKSGAVNVIPMRRMGRAQEVASLAGFLATDAASYITGEVIKVDGGLYI